MDDPIVIGRAGVIEWNDPKIEEVAEQLYLNLDRQPDDRMVLVFVAGLIAERTDLTALDLARVVRRALAVHDHAFAHAARLRRIDSRAIRRWSALPPVIGPYQ